jgi:hypothetical protein
VSRVKPFILRVSVSREYLRLDPGAARAMARVALRDQAGALTGPRGGRYVAINQPFDFQEGTTDDDFMRNTVSFTARVTGRYVRPLRG